MQLEFEIHSFLFSRKRCCFEKYYCIVKILGGGNLNNAIVVRNAQNFSSEEKAVNGEI